MRLIVRLTVRLTVRESIARGSYSRRFLSQAHLLLLITTSCTDGGFSVNSGDDEDPSAHGSSSVTYYIFSAKPSDQNQGGSGGEKNLHDINGMSSTGGVAM
ncbi:hypothetical protein ISN45_Aa07g024510 [Arabidopsis thaliana x Arabidopsis arenosa]|uniref:Uncharacterized protein n=1 Tax=Arabidopsis thaliana x Arabidopsis arenosa TaxID=1240361 RepID=A0A8T1YAQ8_9BRAS|nr:hypothetical protein ISN45_Aa07g024510 [Arabidopsis thaliana x Arabidopsis arenosa]